MSGRIDVEVGRGGKVRVEFSGFEGELCYEEAENLKRVLRTLGPWAVPVTVTPKSASEISLEVDIEEGTLRKVPVG